MLIDIQAVRLRQAEIQHEELALRERLPLLAADTQQPKARREELKASSDFLHILSIIHARLDQGEKENLGPLAEYRPPDSERLYIFSGDPRPFLIRQALLEVSLVAGPGIEGRLPALYYLYQAEQGALAVMAGIHSLPRDYLVAEEAQSGVSPFSASDLLRTFCVYPQRVGSNAFVFRSFPIWLPDELGAEHLEEMVFKFFRANFPDTGPALVWDHPNFHCIAELMRMGWWEKFKGQKP